MIAILLAAFATDSGAQEFFRCTSDGKVTYQETPCPAASVEQKVDATPANTGYDPAQRERILKEGAAAEKKLGARAAKEEEERNRRQAQREADEKREREAQAREEAREYPFYVYGNRWPAGPRPPWGGTNPKPPGPRPQPVTPNR